jgi:purine/pyrimidine-nucleoside phosphorylase
MSLPTQFEGATVTAKANVYFDGNVVSHSLLLPGKVKKTLGLIRPGSYHFKTAAAELMEIVAGSCHVTVDGEKTSRDHHAGASFAVPSNSGFTISVAAGLCEYICTFL